MTPQERQKEIDRLEAKLRASEGREGMAQRCEAIRKAIRGLENAD